MTVSQKMQDALNEQINAELYSAYLYLQMAAWFTAANLLGFGHWMRKQAEEEVRHAMRFYEYLLDRGGKVELKAVAAPEGVSGWKKPLDLFEQTYQHELGVTKRIHNLLREAQKEEDFATVEMLQWFVKEQVEEEASALTIVEQLKMAGDSKGALLALDHHLGKRE